ncbi:MAG: hypothetical protein AB8F78_11555 [Saprospiraceae bacterium]
MKFLYLSVLIGFTTMLSAQNKAIQLFSEIGITRSSYHKLNGGSVSFGAQLSTKGLELGLGVEHNLFSGDRLDSAEGLESASEPGLVYYRTDENRPLFFNFEPKIDNVNDLGYFISIGYTKQLSPKLDIQLVCRGSRIMRNANYIGANLGSTNLTGNIGLDSVYMLIPIRVVTQFYSIGLQPGLLFRLKKNINLYTRLSFSHGASSWYTSVRGGIAVTLK